MKKVKKVAAYIRVSTVYQIDRDSLPVQRSDLKAYAKLMLGTDKIEIFEDAGYSGKNTMRPAYQDMMKRIRAHEFSHVLVWKIDRISRNLLDFAAMYAELKSLGIVFVSKNEQFDTSTAMGEAMLKIILVFAELERNMTSERVTGIMIERARQGKWNGANVPLGYKWDKEIKFPVIDQEEAKIIKLIYEMYIEESSSGVVCRYLNTHNILSKRGGKWTNTTVCNILKNPFYKGTLRYNYRHAGRGNKKDESEWVIVDNNHDGIISPSDWQKVQDKLAENADAQHARDRNLNSKNINPFARLVRCFSCKANLISHKDRQRKNGFEPSTYHCVTKTRGLPCSNGGYISDITLGDFSLNIISNILKAQKKAAKIQDIDQLKAEVLQGPVLSKLKSSDDDGWKLLLTSLRASSDINFLRKQNKEENGECQNLLEEKTRITRALDRLRTLFLYSEAAMPQNEYLTERIRLEGRLKEVEEKLEERQEEVAISDYDFLQMASTFIVSQKLMTATNISYKELATTSSITDEMFKSFFNSVFISIETFHQDIVAVTFKNGIKLSFWNENIK